LPSSVSFALVAMLARSDPVPTEEVAFRPAELVPLLALWHHLAGDEVAQHRAELVVLGREDRALHEALRGESNVR